MSKKKISYDGSIDPQTRFMNLIDEYFASGSVDDDLNALTPEKRLQVMGKFAEFRWGKKTAESADAQSEVNSTSDLLQAVYEKINEKEA